ncbi:hypothetical protein ACF0H5_017310 [Mactra antiquata]
MNNGGIEYVTFDWKTGVGKPECIEACKSTKACCYINFEVKSGLCALVRPRSEYVGTLGIEMVTERKPGYIFGDKSEWNVSQHYDCEMCKNYGKFAATSVEFNLRCGGCKVPDDKPIQGNMFSYGSRILQQCMHVNSSKQTTRQTECSENGTWSYHKDCFRYFGNSRYYVEDVIKRTWHEAKEFCEELSGHLVDIQTEEEQRFLENMLTDFSDHSKWIGANDVDDNDVLKWTDGALLSDGFQNWATETTYHENGDCAKLRGVWDMNPLKWRLDNCSLKRRSICEIPLVN